jgi:prepilin-type N-terminal cleavage/methylation domain-containing protein
VGVVHAGADDGGADGFTLIETIVVPVILGVAMSIMVGFIPRRNADLELANVSSRLGGAMRLT